MIGRSQDMDIKVAGMYILFPLYMRFGAVLSAFLLNSMKMHSNRTLAYSNVLVSGKRQAKIQATQIKHNELRANENTNY